MWRVTRSTPVSVSQSQSLALLRYAWGKIAAVISIPSFHKIGCLSRHVAKGWKIFKAMLYSPFDSMMSLWSSDSRSVHGVLTFLLHFLLVSIPRLRSRVRIRRCWLQPVRCSWASLRARLLRLPWRLWRDTREPLLPIWLWRFVLKWQNDISCFFPQLITT